MSLTLRVVLVNPDCLVGEELDGSVRWNIPFSEFSSPVLTYGELSHYPGVVLRAVPSGKGLASCMVYGQLFREVWHRKESAGWLQGFFLSKALVTGSVLEWHPSQLILAVYGLRVRYRDPSLVGDFREIFRGCGELSGVVTASDKARCRFVLGPQASVSVKVSASSALAIPAFVSSASSVPHEGRGVLEGLDPEVLRGAMLGFRD